MATKSKSPKTATHHVAPPKKDGAPVKVKAWQVDAFYKLLCDVGMDEYVQQVIDARRETNTSTRQPVTVDVQLEAGQENADVESISFDLDMGHLWRVLGAEGRMLELFSIITGERDMDVVSEMDMEEVMDFFPGFAAVSLAPIGMLMGFGQGMG